MLSGKRIGFVPRSMETFRWRIFRLNSNALSLNQLFFFVNRKDLKKVSKLEAQIPYHEGRGNKDEVVKIKEQIANIWEKAKEAQQL